MCLLKSLKIVVCLSVVCGAARADKSIVKPSGEKLLLPAGSFIKPDCPDIMVRGKVMRDNGIITAEQNKATVHVGQDNWRNYTAEFDLGLKPGAKYPVNIRLGALLDPHVWHRSHRLVEVVLTRDKAGYLITVDSKTYKDKSHNGDQLRYQHKFAPVEKFRMPQMKQEGIKAGSWHGRKLRMKIEQTANFARIWFDHRLITEFRVPDRAYGGFDITLDKGDSISDLEVRSNKDENPLFVTVPLDLYLNDDTAGSVPAGMVTIDNIPFLLDKSGKNNNLFMKNAHWREYKSDPGNYYGSYERGEWFAGDPSRPFFRIPSDDYTAVWLLATADDRKELSEVLSLRIGKIPDLVRFYDFQTMIPRKGEKVKNKNIRVVKVGDTELFLVRVPLRLVLTQDFEDFMSLDLNKSLKLAVRQPDPCRFRIRPLGLPCGVHVFGMTLERSPVRMVLSSPESGNVFNSPQQPRFTAALENLTDRKQRIQLTAISTDTSGAEKVFKDTLSLLPYEKTPALITFPEFSHGFYKLSVQLAGADGHQLVERQTTFALLPENTRDYSLHAPWGTWNFNGDHGTSNDIDKYGPLMRKLGIRFTLKSSDEKLAKYGIRHYESPRTQVKGCSKNVSQMQTIYPNMVKRGLIFHEDAISGAHVTRLPDCILGRSPYKFNKSEQKRFDAMWNGAIAAAEEMRKKHPDLKLQLGNGNPHLVEEFLRRGFPQKYLDSIGNENCALMRPPEAQPDLVSFSTLWIFREIMKHYGYGDIPLDICYEWMCHNTSPGNLTTGEQRDYYMRDALLGLAWGLRFINPGGITDVGNGFYNSNWGASGFCYGIPEMNPKPSYVGFATLTQILDGAKFREALKTGSSSLYCLRFTSRKNESIYALWTVRGKRELDLKFDKDCKFKLTDWQSRDKFLKTANGYAGVSVTSTPVFLTADARIKEIIPGKTVYKSRMPRDGQLINRLDNLAEWKIEKGRNLELESHNFSSPRRKGNFSFSAADGSIRIKAEKPEIGKPIQAMYEVMALKNPVTLKGEPKEIGLMVNGNSCWGRIIFELEDASGQRWISIGASQDGTPTRWMADWMPQDELDKVKNMSVADWNTNDSEARSAINFDGWRYLSFPLPGQYEGEDYHWPRNCYWKFDKDGKVHYPLKFTKLVVELREKVVYIKDMIEPSKPDICIKDLVAGE